MGKRDLPSCYRPDSWPGGHVRSGFTQHHSTHGQQKSAFRPVELPLRGHKRASAGSAVKVGYGPILLQKSARSRRIAKFMS